MASDLDISILIATYNRAECLRETLESMARVDTNGMAVEFVVIDNNSSDHTKEVVESFMNRLPIRYLFEPRPGKNVALNHALDEVELGDIVVFTDDDVRPRDDWLKAIASITKRRSDYSVFGGKVEVIWPDDIEIPNWVNSPLIMQLGFAWHDYGDKEKPYASDVFPFGSNFWVRRDVFSVSRRFNESIGPRPKNRIMGSETSFLKQLSKDGYGIIHSPFAVVGHHVYPKQVSMSNILSRAYRCGRQGPHLGGLCRLSLFKKHPVFWLLIRIGSIVRASFQYLKGMVCLSSTHSVEMKVTSLIDIGYNTESLKLAWQETRK